MKQYIVDAFADEVFHGNPAAVCVLDRWLSDDLMQKIAAENQLSETAFVVPTDGRYRLRWFTPKSEIDLCGHATLAAAFVLFQDSAAGDTLHFDTLSGALTVVRTGNGYEMDFPAYSYQAVPVTKEMERAFGARPVEAYLSRDLLAVFDSEETVRNMAPNQEAMKLLDGLCISVTAPGTAYDCVSRVFAPELAVPEDPVTGSTHCLIAPYWSDRLKKKTIRAFQASSRTGVLVCTCQRDRVKIAGNAVLFSVGEIFPTG